MNVGMVFGIIFAIIVMGFVIAFGLPMIMDAGCAQEQIKISSTLNDFEQKVNEVYSFSRGSVLPYSLSFSGSKICFVDYENPGASSSTWAAPDSAVQGLIRGQNYTIWYSHCKGESGKEIEHLNVVDNFCFLGSGRVYLENMGTYVGISILS
ncbi:MAG: hypothetical protein KJ613_03220 [Nanoarchaeota archaeon]|nr:hypothetical protein [Nanoarchaeota archaeon]